MDYYSTVESIPAIRGVPIYGVAGDQQAALFGQTCFRPGQAKNTYGTGSFLVMNTGDRPVRSERGLATTLAVEAGGGPCYALEGSVFVAGAAIQWLRDELRILKTAAESEVLARSIPDNGGVYLVPAFAGLGAPHWDMEARGAVVGLTRGTGAAHLARAALEAMAYQSEDVLALMEEESGIAVECLMVDGGATANDFLMQFQADISGRPVLRPRAIESTALGAAMLAGLRAGFWADSSELEALKEYDRRFEPRMESSERERLKEGWRRALRQTRTR
jgi:glycerol kinase